MNNLSNEAFNISMLFYLLIVICFKTSALKSTNPHWFIYVKTYVNDVCLQQCN